MKKYLQNKIIVDIGFELLGNILIAAGTYNVAVASEFPLSGFNGIAMVFYRLFHFPIGMTVLILNLIPALLCLKIIGKAFVFKTFRCMIMATVLIDYVAPLFPVYTGDRIIAAIVTGTLFG